MKTVSQRLAGDSAALKSAEFVNVRQTLDGYLASVQAFRPRAGWLDRIHKDAVYLQQHEDEITCVAFVPTAEGSETQLLISGSRDDTINFWRRNRRGKWVDDGFEEDDDDILSIACSPDGSRIAVGVADGSVSVYDGDGEYIDTILAASDPDDRGPTSVAYSPDGRRLLVGDPFGHWDCGIVRASDGKPISKFEDHDNEVTAVAYAPQRRDGQPLVATSGGDNHDIFLWNPNTGDRLAQIVSRGNTVLSLAFSPDGRQLAYGNKWTEEDDDGDGYPLQHVFNLQRIEPGGAANLHEPRGGWRRALAECDGLSAELRRGRERLLVFKDGEKLGRIDTGQESERILCWTFVPDLDEIIFGTNFGLYHYDATTGEELDNYVGHSGAVITVAVSPDGTLLASGGSDQTIRLWNIETGEMLLTIFVARDGEWVVWSEEGFYKSSPAGDSLFGWHVNRGEEETARFYEAAQFRSLYDRPEIIELVLGAGGIDAAVEQYNRNFASRPRERSHELSRSLTQSAPPEIRILDPPDGITAAAERIMLSFHVQLERDAVQNGANLYLRVMNNGRPVSGWEKQIRRTADVVAGQNRFHVPITLKPGRQQLSVIAWTGNEVRSKLVGVEVNSPAPAGHENSPHLLVLAIGVSQHLDERLNLQFADADATGLQQAFRGQQGRAFNSVDAMLLTNQQATAENIQLALAELDRKARASANAVVCICVAGHGTENEAGSYFFVPHEFERSKPPNVTGMRWTEFIEPLQKLPNPVVLLMDTCHSASVTGESSLSSESLSLQRTVKQLVDPKVGVHVLASSLSSQKSLERPEWKHGAFTKAVLEALSGHAVDTPAPTGAATGRGFSSDDQANSDDQVPIVVPRPDANGDGRIDLSELQRFVSARVSQLTGGRQIPKAYPRELNGGVHLSRLKE